MSERVRRLVPNLNAGDGSETFYVGLLGLKKVMDHGWVSTYARADEPDVQVSLLAADPSGLHPVLSVGIADVDAAHAQVQELGLEIAYPLQDEPWGVRRFFVRDPAGNLVNIVGHRAEP